MAILIHPSAFKLPHGPLVEGDIVSYNRPEADGTHVEEARYMVVNFAGKVPAENSSEKLANFTYQTIVLFRSPDMYVWQKSFRVGGKHMIVIQERTRYVPHRNSPFYGQTYEGKAFAYTGSGYAWVLEERLT